MDWAAVILQDKIVAGQDGGRKLSYSAVLSGGVVHGSGGDKNGGKGGDQSGTGVKV